MNSQTKERVHITRQRWWVLVASCLINMCIGSLYAWSVFSSPMAEYLNKINGTTLTVSNLAIVFTIANLVGPITMISGGFVNDRIGPRWIIFIGGLMFGGGMLLCSIAKNITMLILGFGLGCGLAMGLVYSCTVNNSIKFFPDHRGLIGGVVTATYGISSVIVPPIATRLIEYSGIDAAFRFFGIVFIAAICGGSFLVRRCPPDFIPYGWQPKSQTQTATTKANKNWNEMLISPIFYVMLFMLTCGAFSGLMVISQASPIAQKVVGMTPAKAAEAVSALALFNGAGRVLAGWLSDRFGPVRTLQAVFFLYMSGLGLLIMTHPGRALIFFIGIALIGFCFGSFMGIFPGFTADQFGTKNNSVNYGIMFIGFALAGFLGPMGMSALRQVSGSYITSFQLGIVLCVIGLILTCLHSRLESGK